jgi:anti-anti-sigma regulatory factor
MHDTDSGHIVMLPPVVGIAAAAELKEAMLRTLESSAGTLLVDASAVQRVDTAGVQLLLALCNRAMAEDRDLQWRGDTTVLAQAVAALGLDHLLALPGEAAH